MPQITLVEALLKLPKNFYLKSGVEGDPDHDPRLILTAVLMEEPPEGGWPSLAAYFNNPGYREDAARLKMYKSDDIARAGVSVFADEPQAFERLVVGMILNRWP